MLKNTAKPNRLLFALEIFITNNLSVERKKVMDVGMFDNNIVRYGYEDYDLGVRLYKSGCKFVMADHIISLHQEHPGNYKPDDLLLISIICAKSITIYILSMYPWYV